ncbi:LacI family DNA-binding transcriptional regulator [Streptomyces sp. TS71-3]|uniref:LacI family DNA-binding transcriptional regulator n=1 Tax=Streptomyces sp. TS71-3 TaxID=2733862 RepID=UPI001B0A9A80|nr:LacI family DNA-binding transcriptional regulator [Streptomyces sp. TS71-3]GHJ41029.1 LacI family transcriptional regulator [Streptomyces sp. TS71-3]
MPPAQRHPTMADVAQRAGVSVSTVSRTLRGLSTVSPDARRRVEEAARELSFVISRQASGLVTGKTGAVAVLVPTLKSWFVGAALSGLGEVLLGTGLDLLVYSVSDLAERAAFFDRLPARRNADALLVVSFDLTEQESARLDDLGIPIVYVSQQAPGRASVYVDDVAGARAGVRHLVNLGHRRIAYVHAARGPSGFSFSSQRRFLGYREALAEAGIGLDEQLVVDVLASGRRGAEEAVGGLLGLREPPTAIFAEIDQVAIEVMGVLRSAGLDVPGRVSVLGFDDHEMAEWMQLSTIAQPAEDIGRAAGELARSLIDDPDADPARHRVLPTRLIPRASTAPLRTPHPRPAPDAGSTAERSTAEGSTRTAG